MANKHCRQNLIVPAAIAQRVKAEAEFLGAESRVVGEDDRAIKSRADFIRWAADLYIEACEAGEHQEWEYDETATIPISIDSHTRGRWEYAIKRHYAASYHQLVSFALCRYFDRLDNRTDADEQVLRNLQVMPVSDIITNLRQGIDFVPITTSAL